MNTPRLASRRHFLRLTAAGALVSALCPLAPVSNAAPSGWITAIRDGHLKATGEATCWAALERLGASAVEVLVNEEMACPGLYDPDRTYRIGSVEDRRTLQEDLTKHGVTITALCMANRLEERLERELTWMGRVAEAAEQLKVRAIRIDVVPHRMPNEQFLDFAVDACRRLCAVIKGAPVRLGIENHGQFTNDPVLLEKLLDRVGSEQLGLTLDAMNFYWFGHPLEDVYRLCEKFASRVYHTHCKNLQYPEAQRNVRRPIGWEYEKYAAPLYQGDLDYTRIAAILRKADYRGDLCLENECLGRFPKDQHVSIMKEELATLRRLATMT